jgi:hypothetical protein
VLVDDSGAMTGDLKEAQELIEKMDLRTAEKRSEVQVALSSLLRSQSWQFLKVFLEGEEKRLTGNLITFTKPEDVQRWIGELKQVKGMLGWPDMMLKTIVHLNHAEELRKQRKEGKDVSP